MITKFLKDYCIVLALGTSLILKGTPELEKKIDDYIQVWCNQSRFSGSVLVAKNDEIILSKGYGFANYEFDISNSSRTKFRIGSITKLFTAIAILQLQEQELLKVTDTIDIFFPDYPRGNEITIHHLLTHTSGIPGIGSRALEIDINTLKSSVTLEQTISWFKDKPLEFDPGTYLVYSNSGYILLSSIIEKVSGKTYEEFVRENIFDYVGMNNSGRDNPLNVVKNRASGYIIDMYRNGELYNAEYCDQSWAVGAGWLYSTVEDLYLLDRTLYSASLLNDTSLMQLITPYTHTNQGDGCGYGCWMSTLHDHRVVYHSGLINGFKSLFSHFRSDNVCIIILSNIANAPVDRMGDDIAAIIFNKL